MEQVLAFWVSNEMHDQLRPVMGWAFMVDLRAWARDAPIFGRSRYDVKDVLVGEMVWSWSV